MYINNPGHMTKMATHSYMIKKTLNIFSRTSECGLISTKLGMYMTIIVKQVYWYISQISGERVEDHWSCSNFKHGECVLYKVVRCETLHWMSFSLL